MRYVILRDDDTNALTPVPCLERLYRPWLDRGLPVNLATIPLVRTDTRRANGQPEGFLTAGPSAAEPMMAIGSNRELVRYLRGEPGYHIVQHGFHHDLYEFDRSDRSEIARRLDQGAKLLLQAGFPPSATFVAPYDRLSRPSLEEVAKRFQVLSSGWYELRRLPLAWWPNYVLKKARRRPHWRVGSLRLLSHPGCLLSCTRPHRGLLDTIRQIVERQDLTVLVTHWWEYFPDHQPHEAFIQVLHQTGAYLAQHPDLRVVSFEDLAAGRVPLP